MPAMDLEKVRAVTSNYFFWQGLRWVPLGIVLVGAAAALSAGSPVAEWWELRIFSVSLVIALWLSSSALGRYYRRRFGHVRADPELYGRRTSIKWLVVYPAMLASMVIDLKVALPVLVSGVVWGVSLEAYRRSTGAGRPHYTIAAALLVALGLSPAAGAGATGRDGVTLLVGVMGVVYIVGGVLDHLALVRMLGRGAGTAD